MHSSDPLTVLPPEIVLRIVDFSSISSLAALTATSKAWNSFVDVTHQDAIYASPSKTPRRSAAGALSFNKYFEGSGSWKDTCKRHALLRRNWDTPRPLTREATLQVGNEPVWRFKADFKRRFFVSTSMSGGLNVTDMDSGRIIWRLPSAIDADSEASVRPFAHLEYQDGMAVWDRNGDAVEVWVTDVEGCARGEFRRIAILEHDCFTRGFQLSHWTLCVVSSQGKGFVYDVTQRPVKLVTTVTIEHGAVGHLDQSADVVIYSMGTKGYHAHDKKTGAFLGAIQPWLCTEKYHLRQPTMNNRQSPAAALAEILQQGPSDQAFALGQPKRECLTPVEIGKGPLPPPTDPEHVFQGENEWGAGMINGDIFAGYSHAGHVFICSDWRKALESSTSFQEHSALLECESDGSSFDLGGWLSVRNHRVMFEVEKRVYVVGLDDEGRILTGENSPRPSYCFFTSSTPNLSVPVSFMAIYDDAIMTTYTTLGWRQNAPGNDAPHVPARIFPTKVIQIISLAPDLNPPSTSSPGQDQSQGQAADQQRSQNNQQENQRWGSHAGLMQLASMLGADLDDDDDDDGDGGAAGGEADLGDEDEEETDEFLARMVELQGGEDFVEIEEEEEEAWVDAEEGEGGHEGGHGQAQGHGGA